MTSRAPLRLSGEQEFPVAPLPAPDAADLPALDALADNPAVALFVDRATRVRPDFTLRAENAADVADLCARLDGLPLAIELAAARMKMLSPGALLRLLDRGPAGARLRLLSSGPRDLPARQRTMHETMRWSYDLLNPNEQRLLRRLAVFAGGCTLDAALAICGPGLVDGAGQPLDVQLLDLVAALADNSLIYQPDGPDHEPRYLLLETISELELEHLIADGEETELRRRHAAHYLALVESTGALLFAAAPLRTRAAAEQDNIQAALRWLVQHG